MAGDLGGTDACFSSSDRSVEDDFPLLRSRADGVYLCVLFSGVINVSFPDRFLLLLLLH